MAITLPTRTLVYEYEGQQLKFKALPSIKVTELEETMKESKQKPSKELLTIMCQILVDQWIGEGDVNLDTFYNLDMDALTIMVQYIMYPNKKEV
jgi:hypothetical protein